jgi:hypothetical protein
METRRFIVCYQRTPNMSEEREVFGTPEDALRTAWHMLQDGSAKVAAIIEPGNLGFNIFYGAILRWGEKQKSP